MSRDIYFITHPDVVIDPSVPVQQWRLSARGRQRMRCLLARDWTGRLEAIYCSTERKARDGAAILSEATGVSCHELAALGENDRSATGYLPKAAFETMVDAFFANPRASVRGWEPAVAAQARIVGALQHISRVAPGVGPIAVVSHGGVGALLLCRLKGVAIARAEEQPGVSGGNYFVFRAPEGALLHGWTPIDA